MTDVVMPSNWRVPFVWLQVDNADARSLTTTQRTLIMGPMMAAGTATANALVLVARGEEADGLFGEGSVLARMVHAYRANDPYGEVWCMPLADDAAGVPAAGSIEVTGPATGDGMLRVYIAGQLVECPVADGELAVTIAANLKAVIDDILGHGNAGSHGY